MARQTVNNGDLGSVARGKINGNFTELYPKKAEITSDGTSIIFATPIPEATEFEVFPISCMFAGNAVGVYFSDITVNGFTATSAEPTATLLWNVLTF